MCCVPRASFGGGGAPSATDEGSRATALALADAAAPPRARFPGGASHVGTDRPVIESDGEGPRRPVVLQPFAIDTVPVTNRRFAAFVRDTGTETEAERFGWAPVFRGLLGEPPTVPAGPLSWWTRRDGACWHAPEGPGSDVADRLDHPVVHVSWHDAQLFARWAGGRLPSEAEWEHAARSGSGADLRFPWGNKEPTDEEAGLCNIWQGDFPHRNACEDGWYGTSPAGLFPPNGAGLHDVIGNVWEWTGDPFRVRSLRREARARDRAARREGAKVMKGGSFLCHRSYCYRYRIAARSPAAPDSGTSNTGLRVAYAA